MKELSIEEAVKAICSGKKVVCLDDTYGAALETSVLPLVTEDQDHNVAQIILAASISGGAQYKNEAPEHLSLLVSYPGKKSFFVRYDQAPDAISEVDCQPDELAPQLSLPLD